MQKRRTGVCSLLSCFVMLAVFAPMVMAQAQDGQTAQAPVAIYLPSAVGFLPVAAQATRTPDVIYVPTPQDVVDGMLKMADVKAGDVVYDLGSGDGRIPITAVQKFGAVRAIGIDIDPQRIKEANENAVKAGVTDKVKFLNQDLFTTDFSEATVITLYLLTSLNQKLRPQLLELKPGTRIVSHAFDMGDWVPEKTERIGGSTIYFWTVPEK
jgi:hypothetical protein